MTSKLNSTDVNTKNSGKSRVAFSDDNILNGDVIRFESATLKTPLRTPITVSVSESSLSGSYGILTQRPEASSKCDVTGNQKQKASLRNISSPGNAVSLNRRSRNGNFVDVVGHDYGDVKVTDADSYASSAALRRISQNQNPDSCTVIESDSVDSGNSLAGRLDSLSSHQNPMTASHSTVPEMCDAYSRAHALPHSPRSSDGSDVMAYQEFDELPPMWEDGGTRAVDSYFKIDFESHVWHLETVPDISGPYSQEDVVSGAAGQDDDKKDDDSLEHREDRIERTLREIYASPFQTVSSSVPSASPLPINKRLANVDGKAILNRNGLAISFEGGHSRHDRSEHSFQENDKHRSDSKKHFNDSKFKDLVAVTEDKSSLLQVAQKATSGYRSCADADSYVGKKQPKLILAKAPPNPSGILRRNNRRVVKAGKHLEKGGEGCECMR